MKSNISRRSFLKKSILGGTGLVATAGGLSASSIFRASQPFDTIIQNGLICTGDGTAPYRGDVGIKDGRIAALGRLGNYADHLVDVDGMAISPGFVDLHSHTDTNLFQCPRGDSRIFQGITTEAGGNCGDSPFPVKP